jgi:long-chain acyl-CoA synthetase
VKIYIVKNLFLVDQTEAYIVIVEDDKKVNLLLDKTTKHLKKIVAIKELRPSTLQRAKNQGIDILMFDEVEKLGALKNHIEEPPHANGKQTHLKFLLINLIK